MADYGRAKNKSHACYCVCIEDEVVFESARHAERCYSIGLNTIAKAIDERDGRSSGKTFAWFKRSAHAGYKKQHSVSVAKGATNSKKARE